MELRDLYSWRNHLEGEVHLNEARDALEKEVDALEKEVAEFEATKNRDSVAPVAPVEPAGKRFVIAISAQEFTIRKHLEKYTKKT